MLRIGTSSIWPPLEVDSDEAEEEEELDLEPTETDIQHEEGGGRRFVCACVCVCMCVCVCLSVVMCVLVLCCSLFSSLSLSAVDGEDPIARLQSFSKELDNCARDETKGEQRKTTKRIQRENKKEGEKDLKE